MAKKKRTGVATAAPLGSSAPVAPELLPLAAFKPVDVEKSAASRGYEELLVDPVHTPWTLARSLWLHSVVGLFVHSALVYDEVRYAYRMSAMSERLTSLSTCSRTFWSKRSRCSRGRCCGWVAPCS